MAHTPDAPPTAPAADEVLIAPRRGFLAAGWAKFSDNAIPSLVVAIIAGLVLFFFNETSDSIASLGDRITRVEENQQEIAVTLATLIGEFAAFQQDVDNRFDAVDARFAAFQQDVDNRFDAVDTRLTAIETRLAKLEDNQQEIAVTLARLVALLEARGGALTELSH